MTTVGDLRKLAIEGDEALNSRINSWLEQPIDDEETTKIIIGMLVRIEHFRQYTILLESVLRNQHVSSTDNLTIL